jgi:hypothetical protein
LISRELIQKRNFLSRENIEPMSHLYWAVLLGGRGGKNDLILDEISADKDIQAWLDSVKGCK